jgi:hypothetical protein
MNYQINYAAGYAGQVIGFAIGGPLGSTVASALGTVAGDLIDGESLGQSLIDGATSLADGVRIVTFIKLAGLLTNTSNIEGTIVCVSSMVPRAPGQSL